MKKLTLCTGIALLMSIPAYAEDMSIEDWYRHSYAVLWGENSWDKVSDAAAHYAAMVHVHSPEAPGTAVASEPWLAKGIAGWRADGWQGSDLTALQVDQLNPSAVVFKSKWRDRYADGEEEFSCGWYLADLRDGNWLFTEYADIDCAEHDL